MREMAKRRIALRIKLLPVAQKALSGLTLTSFPDLSLGTLLQSQCPSFWSFCRPG